MNEKQRFVKKVWPKIKDYFDKYGSANFDGYLGRKEQGWHGPYVWNENGDIVRVITRHCEEEFGIDNVHNESKIDKMRFDNFQKGEKKRSIDIDITDATVCKNHYDFRRLKHTLFIEVKHIPKGAIRNDPLKKRESFKSDCKKLQDQIDSKRCKYAIAILIDDGNIKDEPYIENVNELLKDVKKDHKDIKALIWQKKH